MKKNTTKALVTNALIVALYVVLSWAPGVFNLASGAIQFRLSEALNHLVAFDRKYLFGVVVGVIVYNALFSPMGWLDVLFGGGQSLLGLAVVAWAGQHLPKVWQRQALAIVMMTVTMFLIAIELVWTAHLPFWVTYGSLMLSELVIMAISAPVMYVIDKTVHFARYVN
ncbi:QueT transporter family protein [Lacticaseibacillus salsurivasis]|uniref:QueT transporter family protein n=1 Tax=Lacticaseibacillus salsurivasis TaxID=3081441 RepID=UPI0030C6DE3F